MERNSTAKRLIQSFGQGLTSVLKFIANWLTVILGMKEETEYGKWLRRIVGTSFALLMILLTCTAFGHFGLLVYHRLMPTEDDVDENQFLSRDFGYHEGKYGATGYVYNKDGKKVVKGINWICGPLGKDSLVCYSDGEKRGYFNKYTGKVVIPPQYVHAWIFSEGLASVDDGGWIKFIDSMDRVKIDLHQRYLPGMDGCVFHGGHCVIPNPQGNGMGLIDQRGKWDLKPDFLDIHPEDTFWIVNDGKREAVFSAHLKMVLPFSKARYQVDPEGDGAIYATRQDHTMCKYNLQGQLINDFYISEVKPLMYDTNRVHYAITQFYDRKGRLLKERAKGAPSCEKGVARCRYYQTDYGWYGLISPDGHILTPPAYSDICAIGLDLYLCDVGNGNGMILDGTGHRVK